MKSKLKKIGKEHIMPIAVILAILVIWQLACTFEWVPGYMLPSPIDVLRVFPTDSTLLLHHAGATLLEAGLGLVIGVLLGFGSAAIMDAFPVVKNAVYPLLVITQTIPPVALAPLLILWFSYGIVPKVILVVLVAYFPMAVGLLEGFQGVDPDMIRLMKSMNANRWQIFWNVKFPNALGSFFSGLKIAVSYSVVGAVIAEWLGGFTGLGVYMIRVKKSLSYDKMFAVIILVSFISLLLMELVKLVQYKSMPWVSLDDRESGK